MNARQKQVQSEASPGCDLEVTSVLKRAGPNLSCSMEPGP